MENITEPARDLAALGWHAFFQDQLLGEEADLVPMRIAIVHRSRLTAISVTGTHTVFLPHKVRTTDFAVGDWLLVNPETDVMVRRLDRKSLLRRRVEGAHLPQLISANVDTLFVVSSCNADFNPARLERYLAIANDAGTYPVIVLTKIDQTDDAQSFVDIAKGLQRDLAVIAVDSTHPDARDAFMPWCAPGQTVALIGSSGVGKSTLLNALAEKKATEAQATNDIREDDAKGRHTTTSRSLHATREGAWVIDTPGMRTLHMGEVAEGIEMLFAEIVELAPNCRFRNCTHIHEVGCAVLAAVGDGSLDSARYERWKKLDAENRQNTVVHNGPRGGIKKVPYKKKRY